MKTIMLMILTTVTVAAKINAGSLAVSCLPVMGDRSHSHALAIWIEDDAGQFVKTLTRCGNIFYTELATWMDKSNGNTTDAITSATLVVYDTTISGTWNLTNRNGSRVTNGDYWYCIEMANWGNVPVLAKTKISIDGTSETKTSVDSSQNNAAAYITNVRGVYTDRPLKIMSPYHSSTKRMKSDVHGDTKHVVSVNGRLLPADKKDADLKGFHQVDMK
jgi:hypothetical protein